MADDQPDIERVAFVYIVECRDGTLYTGWTYDVAARVRRHNTGRGAKYTRPRLPVTLVYTEELANQRLARQREHALKQLSRPAKQQLLRGWQPGPLAEVQEQG